MEIKTFTVLLISMATLGTFSAICAGVQPSSALTNTTTSTTTAVTFEGTAMSTVDALPGHQGHQSVIVLPVRADGKIWVGTLSWTASKPVEARLLYDYDSSLKTDAIHGKPITAPLAFTTEVPHLPVGEVAIALIKPTNIITSGGTYYAGSIPFVAKAVALHNINGTRFTVTYAVDATAKPLTK